MPRKKRIARPVFIWYLYDFGDEWFAGCHRGGGRIESCQLTKGRFDRILKIAEHLSKVHDLPVSFSGALGLKHVHYDLSRLQDRVSAGHDFYETKKKKDNQNG